MEWIAADAHAARRVLEREARGPRWTNPERPDYGARVRSPVSRVCESRSTIAAVSARRWLKECVGALPAAGPRAGRFQGSAPSVQ